MKPYDHKKIEKKWQKEWEAKKAYKTLSAKEATEKGMKPYYVLDMFPYPSGSGLHVGHPRGYIASDVFARMKRMEGYNVLHPMGFDSFGLPAEQYAIQTGKNPGPFTNELVKRYREQLSILGFSYDWDRQVATHDPEYYKWTQWVFLQIYNSWYDENSPPAGGKARPISELVKIFEETDSNWKNLSEKEQQDVLMNYRLAYEGYATVNWCEEMGTVLANDEVVEKNGKMVSERGEYPVVKKQMRQWFMRITAYADRLLAGLDTIDWPHSIKEIQKNWIGKSEGSEIDFKISNSEEKITVFTTRADTLFGVTYVVLAPEHELVQSLKSEIKNWDAVETYIKEVKSKSDEDRAAAKEKTGVVLEGIFAINPANNESVPVWIADYVLASYGTGAVMAVPAHDERDFEFAKKYKLPMREVVIQSVNEFQENKDVALEKNIGALGIIVRSEDDKILLQYDGATGFWRLPGGSLDQGETPEAAVLREIEEEVGYRGGKITKAVGSLHVYFHKIRAKTMYDRRAYGFVVDISNATEVPTTLSESEATADMKHEWCEPQKALKLLQSNSIVMGEVELLERYISGFETYTEEGILVDSGKFDGLTSAEAKKAITEFVGGKLVTKYKMRDAIFARQRYWGEPIPLKHVSLEEEHKNAFEVPFYSDRPFDLISRKEKTVETRALDKPGRDKVKVGDIVRIEHLPTKRMLFARVTEVWRFKTIKDLWENGRDLVKEIRPDAETSSYEDWFAYYSNVDPGYEKRCDTHGMAAWRLELLEGDIIEDVPENDLPLELPKVKSYAPAGDGQSPLATVSSWVKAGYETNTMPGWAGSSWYFLRYADPKNKNKFADDAELDYWFSKDGGVNMYVGGAEHATGHLLYSRFWHKVLKDLGHVQPEEPFQTLRNQGMIGGADGRKMSKRWGNVINPDDVVRDLGADTMRVYESFMGPFEAHLPWSTDGIVGSRRFIERVWRLQEKVTDQASSSQVQKSLHKTIKKVTDDIRSFGFNTAVSSMMILVNDMEKAESIHTEDFKKFLQILAPFAPHVTEDLWEVFGEEKSIHLSAWPVFDPQMIIEDSITMGIQVNGKVRAEIELGLGATEDEVKEKVMQMPEIQKWMEGKEVKKFIFIPKKIISIVVL